ncbi:MAG TPA: PKD domain-containing protein [Patescibacteria group bacterium]|nr:PKD domain-containing protein [Patescibacteria group bacterium]
MGLYKRFLLKGLLAGAIITTVVGAGAILFNTKQSHATSSFDCDNNAVLYCGAQDATTHVASTAAVISKYDHQDAPGPKYTDIPAIYNSFGITSAGVHSLASKVVVGQVHKDGTVWLNGQEIGNGAMSAGRVNFAGSTPIPGTGAFMRPPSVSFGSNSLDAYIGYENGQPAWAILVSCGNPIKFQHPHISITKTVQNKQGAFVKDATFNNEDTVRYRLVVTNTGPIPVTNVHVADVLPAGQIYDTGSTKVNGSSFHDGIIATAAHPSSINIGTLAPGASATVSFAATISLPQTQCTLKTMTNAGLASADFVGLVGDTAKTEAKAVCVGKCTSITADSYQVEEGSKLTFTANTTTHGVTVVSYVFRVDGNVVQNSSKKTYDFVSTDLGVHTVSVMVHFSDGTFDGGDGLCAHHVNVTPKPGTVSCDSLSADKSQVQAGETIVFTAKASTTGSGKIDGYTFKVNGKVVPNTTGPTFNFVPTQDGTYTVSVTVNSNKGDVTSAACTKQVTVKTAHPVISCDSLTADKTVVQPGEQIVFTAQGSATGGANILTYNFALNGTPVQSTPSNVYNFAQTPEGTYTVSVTVHTDKGDATSDACTKQVKVQKVVSPVTSCDLLSVDKASINTGDSITATLSFTAANGATFKQANFLFGDEADATKTTPVTQLDSNGHAVISHTYSKVGDFTITGTVDFMVNGVALNGVTSPQCVAKVTIGAVLPATTPPTELINTGPGDITGIFAGTSLAGAFLHRRWTLRKNSK